MSDLTPEKLAELRRLAATAADATTERTPWYSADDLLAYGVESEDDAPYIAALTPPIVLALLDAADERDRLAGLLDEPRRSGCAVEIAGVRIAPCDERGQTADMRALDTAADRLAHMTEARDNARAEVERLTALVEAVRATAEHYDGLPYAGCAAAILRALDGEGDQDAQNRP